METKNRTWITQGDERIYFFHTYDKMRQKYNHCMSIKDERGEHVHSFKDMVEVEVNHFKNIFKEHPSTNIAKIVKMAELFPNFVIQGSCEGGHNG